MLKTCSLKIYDFMLYLGIWSRWNSSEFMTSLKNKIMKVVCWGWIKKRRYLKYIEQFTSEKEILGWKKKFHVIINSGKPFWILYLL